MELGVDAAVMGSTGLYMTTLILGASDAHNILWDSIAAEDVFEEQLCSMEGNGELRQRNESDLLGEMVIDR